MTIDEILKLKEAGYTAEEIVNFSSILPKPEEQQQQQQQQQQQNPFETQVNAFVAAMQKMNILQSQQKDNPLGADDALAKILNPGEE